MKHTDNNENQLSPVVIDLGKKGKKSIKKLKKGEGKLMAEVHSAVEFAKEGLGAEFKDQVILPVVLVYKEKSKFNAKSMFPLPMKF